MAVASKLYGQVFVSLGAAQINYTTATVKAMLLTSAYTPDQDNHRFKSDLSGEAVGTGYTAGGQALTSKTVTYTAATNTTTWTCANPAWPTATVAARYLVIYVDTGTSTTSPLISYVDFGADQTATGGTGTYTVPTSGIAQFVAN